MGLRLLPVDAPPQGFATAMVTKIGWLGDGVRQYKVRNAFGNALSLLFSCSHESIAALYFAIRKLAIVGLFDIEKW